METTLMEIGIAVLYLVETLAILLIGMKTYDLVKSNFNLSHELTETDNPAVATSLVGYFIGTVIALLGLYHGGSDSEKLLTDVLNVATFGGLTILLMLISSFITDKLVLSNVVVNDELKKQNTAVGILEASTFIANGCVLYGAMSGDGNYLTALAFWAIGQATLVVSSYVYNMMTAFDSKDQIKHGNSAVALAKGGFIIAVGYIIKVGSKGDFESWSENLMEYGQVVLFCFVCLPLVRIVFDLVIIKKASVCKELAEDRNVGIGLFEGSVYLASALIASTIFMS